MDLDDRVCYCFHVTGRKLTNWVRLHGPKVPSQLSECGGAGTGCGWCIPFLKLIFRRGGTAKACESGEHADLERLSPEEYAALRADYVRAGHGTPAAGAEPLPGGKSSPPSDEVGHECGKAAADDGPDDVRDQ